MSASNKAAAPKRSDGRRNNRPPQQKQFKKGQSGNPRGRPKKPSDHERQRDIVRLSIDEKMSIRENGEARQVSAFEAAMLQLRAKALSGSLPHLKQWLAIAEKYGVLSAAQVEQAVQTGVLVVPARPTTIAEWEAMVGRPAGGGTAEPPSPPAPSRPNHESGSSGEVVTFPGLSAARTIPPAQGAAPAATSAPAPERKRPDLSMPIRPPLLGLGPEAGQAVPERPKGRKAGSP
jgi:Family of unknown function (DUF5681)